MAGILLENGELRVTVTPDVGGTITSIMHRRSGLSVLGDVPWQPVARPLASAAAIDEPEWLTRYTGGWPMLFPNAGDSCTVEGVFHGFHGEASITPWQSELKQGRLHLRRIFETVPAEMRRVITLEGDAVSIAETLHFTGDHVMDVMWGQHPTFGSDLLAGPVEIECAGGLITVDADYDSPSNPLVPASQASWPMVKGKGGDFDLRHPVKGMAALAYLHHLKEPWIAIRRRDDAIAARLSWDDRLLPCAWLWFELCGTKAAPWNGQTSLIGIEPNTTVPAYGIATAKARGGDLLHLNPGAVLTATITLRVYVPSSSA